MFTRDLGIAIVREAGSFAETLTAIARDPDIGMVAVDLGLPGMRSGEGLRQLRMEHPALLVTVVAATGDRDIVLDALCAGVHGYIPKDLPAGEMLDAFRSVLSGHIYVPSHVSDVSAKRVVHVPPRAVPHDPGLTERQHEVLQLLAIGKSNKEIARILRIAEGTVKVHITAAFRMLGVHNRVSAAAILLNWPIGTAAPGAFIPGLFSMENDRRAREQPRLNGSHQTSRSN
jgi:DNA-binding NarL/FixJ family response regulator